MKLTKNFALSEFACNDGTPVPGEYVCNVKTLADQLQVIRDEIKEPLRINSAYRTPTYNKKIGGASKSQHLLAKAADLNVRSLSPIQLHKVIEGLIKKGKIINGGLGLYKGFVHYDCGPTRRWKG